MKFLNFIVSIAKQNKYTKWYCSIIKKAHNLKKEGYVEKHHILPKSFKMGGESDKDNLVLLTAKEHFICHLLLARMFEDPILTRKMRYATLRFFQKNKSQERNLNSRQFEALRKTAFDLNKGKIVSSETKQKIKEKSLKK